MLVLMFVFVVVVEVVIEFVMVGVMDVPLVDGSEAMGLFLFS